jgi:hypothetical protein
MVRNQKIHIDANPAVACIWRDRPSNPEPSARRYATDCRIPIIDAPCAERRSRCKRARGPQTVPVSLALLAAYPYSRDVGRVTRLSEALEYGNTGIISTKVAPCGGMKESGIGREGSRHGIDEFLEVKYVCQGGL